MDLPGTLEFVRSLEKDLVLFNVGPSTAIAEEVGAFFRSQNVVVSTVETASGAPRDLAVLSSSDGVLAMVEVDRLRALMDEGTTGRGLGVGDTAYESILAHLKETTFTSYDTAEMLAATREIEDLAAANQEQAAMVSEVEDSVSRLSEAEATADGGTVVADEAGDDGVSIPEDLPDGMPEFVVDQLPQEQLEAIARGDLDRDDLI